MYQETPPLFPRQRILDALQSGRQQHAAASRDYEGARGVLVRTDPAQEAKPGLCALNGARNPLHRPRLPDDRRRAADPYGNARVQLRQTDEIGAKFAGRGYDMTLSLVSSTTAPRPRRRCTCRCTHDARCQGSIVCTPRTSLPIG